MINHAPIFLKSFPTTLNHHNFAVFFFERALIPIDGLTIFPLTLATIPIPFCGASCGKREKSLYILSCASEAFVFYAVF